MPTDGPEDSAGVRYMRPPHSPSRMGLVKLCSAVAGQFEARPLRMAELGVWAGESMEIFNRHLSLATYVGVDAWTGPKGDWRLYEDAELCYQQALESLRLRTESVCTTFQTLRGRTTDKATLDQVPDRSLDFLYIDADHRYKKVRADILAWLPKLAPGACIGGHDYSFAQALGKGYGVVKAVHEIFYCPDMLFADTSWLVIAPNRRRCRTGRPWDAARTAQEQSK